MRRALAWSFAERYATLVVGLASSMVLARLLTPADMGVYSLCAAVIAIGTMIREFGVGEYLIQSRELDRNTLRNAFAVAFTTAWLIAGGILLSRHWIAGYYAEPRVAELLAILAINFLLLPFSSPAFALLNREMALKPIFYLQVTSSILQSGIAVGLAFTGFGPASLAWSALAGVVVQTIFIAALKPRDTFLMPKWSGSGRIFRYGAYQMSARMLDTLSGNAHEFILARMFGFTAVGLFSRAKGLVDMFHSTVTTAVARVTTPSMAKAHRADQLLTESFARGTSFFTCICWPFFAFLGVAAPEIIRLMFGPQWDESARLGAVLAFAMMPTALYVMAGGVLAATGQVERRLKVSLIFNPVHVVAVLVSAQFGLHWVPLAWLVTTSVAAVAFTYHLRLVLGANLKSLFGPSMRSLPVAVLTGTVCWATAEYARSELWPAIAVLASISAVTVFSWLASVFLLNHPVCVELRFGWQLLMQRSRRAA